MADQRDNEELVEAMKERDGKIDWSLLDWRFIECMAAVMTEGAKKYEPNDWKKGTNWSLYYAAAMRHLTAFWGGEDYDKETDIPHLAHAACCLMIMTYYRHHHAGTDDRSSRPSARRAVPRVVSVPPPTETPSPARDDTPDDARGYDPAKYDEIPLSDETKKFIQEGRKND